MNHPKRHAEQPEPIAPGPGRRKAFPVPAMPRHDRRARYLILSFSVLVFLVVASLHPLHKALGFDSHALGFDVHIFAALNALINTCVSCLLLAAYWLVRHKHYRAHRNAMFVAMALSVLFLISYVTHHILAGDTHYGGTGWERGIYFALLYTHILLAAFILPFILFSVYRGLTGQYALHKRLARWAFPLWLYVSLSGPLIYLMIAPYYS